MSAALLLSTVLPRLLAFPLVDLGPDEVAYALIGRELADGHWPYQTAFDHKPVGLYLPYALVTAPFGPSMTGLRVLTLVTGVLGFVLTYAVCRRLRLATIPSALLASAFGFYTLGLDGLAALSEHLVNVYVLLLVLLLLVRRRAWWVYAATGAVIALTFHTNYISGPIVAVLGLFMLWRERRRPLAWVCSAAGFLVVSGVLLAPILLLSDLGEYVELQVRFVLGYQADPLPTTTRIELLQNLFRPAALLLVPVVLVAVAARSGRTRPMLKWVLLLAVSAAAAAANQFAWPHYALLLAPALIGLIAVQSRTLPRRGAVVLALVTVVISVWGSSERTVSPLTGGAESIMRQHSLASDERSAVMRTTEAVRPLVRPGELVYTRHLHFYLLTGAELPTRFFFPSHHTNPKYTALRNTTPDAEMTAVVGRRPVLVVLDQVGRVPPQNDGPLLDYLQRHCTQQPKVGAARIYTCR